jgi:hypothetical protein
MLRSYNQVMEANERRLGIQRDTIEGLNEIAKAARATGKKAKMVITIEIAPDKNDELALSMEGDVKLTLPKPERKKALIYHDAETKTFSKTDPRQLELLAEQEAERAEREKALREEGIARIGRGTDVATA